ncbi:methionine--tRNA ligase [Fuchsiella alkaliacetigena]|uniref:methionine--tRNA ligase n=1 Tax=Fuchsiella alkaliacetigena TaxID=957042 RepID=UPI00200B2BCD|nr:methionine--tRNA ligase [Fuchsiella alkaliacetigena]MCK8825001.1 methionine--tRNA ligase [Fuchsiella alkaliacetigena]
MSKDTFYVTTPIYYPNDKLHIGHTYTTTAADTIARFKELQGYEVKFLTGSDEHGQKIERAASEAGVSPKQYVDRIVDSFKELWDLLEADYDVFLRTTSAKHQQVVQHIFKKVYEQGDIYKDKYEGWYCTPCESFWLERHLEKGKCPDCQRETEWVEEESYFFKMSKYEEQLLEHIENNPEFIQPETRKKEMINFIKDGLEDLCVSRTTFDWGIPVPIDEEHVIYVWFDALSNYVTGAGYLSDEEEFNKFWPADVHIVGKDILRFHTIIWPIILMAAGLELPERVFGHGFLTVEGGKMSKSKGNVVDPVKLVEDFGVDAVRYYLMREVAFGTDGSYSTEAFIKRLNADLANDLGNLLNRTVAMVDQYFEGVVPELGPTTDYDEDLKATAQKELQAMEANMAELQFSRALENLWTFIRRTNKYIDETTPWVLAKEEDKKAELGTVLYNLLEALRIIAIALKPFLPVAPQKIWTQLGIESSIEEQSWEDALQWGLLTAGIEIQSGEPLFPRVDIEEYFANQVESEAAEEEDSEVETVEQDLISFGDFQELDLRVAEIVEAEEIAGSDKLLKLQVSLGEEQRQVVAGISNYYQPDELLGKQVLMVTNLEPAEIFGVESRGMILAASNDDEELVLTTIDREIETGSKVT